MSRLLLSLILAALLVGQSIACHKPINELSAADLDLKGYEVGDNVKTLAGDIASKLLGASFKKAAAFARELVESYIQTKGKDFVIVYNTGGFGGSSITDDPEWSSVVQGIQAELAKLGYYATVLEHTRSLWGFLGFIDESQDLIRNYSGKAPLLAAKVEFLTGVEHNLKVIITGRSFGAIFSNEVMRYLERNPCAYSVQAGYPFWYCHSPPQNTLVIKDNGAMPDFFS